MELTLDAANRHTHCILPRSRSHTHTHTLSLSLPCSFVVLAHRAVVWLGALGYSIVAGDGHSTTSVASTATCSSAAGLEWCRRSANAGSNERCAPAPSCWRTTAPTR